MRNFLCRLVMGIGFFASVTVYCAVLPPLQVVTGANPKDGEPLAAQDLALYLGKITGTTVPILSEAEAKTNTAPARRLYVGWTDYAKAAGLDGSTMGVEEWAIKTVASDLILTGGRPRGTLFGVYEFLENNCGVHWFDRDTEVVPSNSNFKIPVLDVRDRKQLLFHYVTKREVDAKCDPNNKTDMKEEELAKQERFLRRNRCGNFLYGHAINSLQKSVENKYPLDGTACLRDGGGTVLGGGHLAHTFYNYISPTEFEVSHPEYFGFSRVNVPKENLKPHEGCLCLTLPEVRTLMVERVKQKIVEDRKLADQLGFQYPRIYAISQMDRSLYCPCPECRRFVKEHGQESDLVTDFVNFVADAVGKDYPELTFETTAYQWSLAAPQTIKPHSNVAVLWCNWGWREANGGDNGAFLDQALTHPDNKMRFDLLKRWQQVGAKFFFWDYHYLGSAAIPLVETPYTAGNIKLLNSLGLLGVYIESEENDFQTFPRSYQGPWHKENFFPFRYWITYQLLSKPASDVDVLTDTFFKGYFGPAAGKMREFYNFLITCQEKSREKRQLMLRSYTMDYLTPDFFVTADRLCQEAEAQCAPESAELLRVRQERIRVDLGILELWGDLKRQLPNGKELPFNREQVIARLESAGRAVVAGRPWHNKATCLAELTNLVAYYRQPRLPESFSKLDAAEYIDVTWRCFPSVYVGFPGLPDILDDSTAALGSSILYNGKAGWEKEPVVFKLGQLKFTLAPAEFPTDEQYHTYKLGRMRFVDKDAIFSIDKMGGKGSFGSNLDVTRRLDDCERAAEWDVYISAKIVKPSPNPKKGKGKDGVWLDRIFLVRAVPGAQRPDDEKAALKTYLDEKNKTKPYVSEELKNKLD